MISSRYMCGNFACPHQHFDFSSSVRWVHFPAVAVDGLKISFLQESRGEYSFHLFTDIRELLKHEVPDAIEFINLISKDFQRNFCIYRFPWEFYFLSVYQQLPTKRPCISCVFTNQSTLHVLTHRHNDSFNLYGKTTPSYLTKNCLQRENRFSARLVSWISAIFLFLGFIVYYQ